MELTKSKYKQTEVGLFPEDWKILSIGDSLVFKNGLNKESEFFGYGTPIVNYMDVFKNFGIRRKDIEGKVFLSREEKKNFSARKGDVFFTRTSETQEEIGTSAVLLEDVEDCVFSGFILRGRPKNDIIVPEYYQYCMIPQYVRNQIISTSSYTTRALTNGRFLSKVMLVIPPTIKEQKAIATALSDVDELIASLESLIAKKQAIKQGAMQQLFAEKKKWERKTIKEFGFDISDGNYSAKYPKSSEFKNSGVPFIRANNIKKMTVVDDDMRYISEELHSELKKGHLKKGDILITNRGDIGQTAIVPEKFIGANINAQIVRINTCGKLNRLYFFYFMRLNSTQNHIHNIQTGSALKQLPVNRLLDIEITFPKEDVQTLIGETLFEIDTEILSIETIKAKYQNIKQGMMQELLTGKTRLV